MGIKPAHGKEKWSISFFALPFQISTGLLCIGIIPVLHTCFCLIHIKFLAAHDLVIADHMIIGRFMLNTAQCGMIPVFSQIICQMMLIIVELPTSACQTLHSVLMGRISCQKPCPAWRTGRSCAVAVPEKSCLLCKFHQCRCGNLISIRAYISSAVMSMHINNIHSLVSLTVRIFL